MNDRDKLIELIREAVGGCARHWAAMIADHLLENGVIVQERTPIESFDLSLRAYHALKRAGINTVEELRECDASAIKRMVGVGPTIFKELSLIRDGCADND